MEFTAEASGEEAQHCAFVWLIGIIGEANCLPRNGC